MISCRTYRTIDFVASVCETDRAGAACARSISIYKLAVLTLGTVTQLVYRVEPSGALLAVVHSLRSVLAYATRCARGRSTPAHFSGETVSTGFGAYSRIRPWCTLYTLFSVFLRKSSRASLTRIR